MSSGWATGAPRPTASSAPSASSRSASCSKTPFGDPPERRYNRRSRPRPRRVKPVRSGRFLPVGAAAGGPPNEGEHLAREALITQEGLEKLESEIEHLST